MQQLIWWKGKILLLASLDMLIPVGVSIGALWLGDVWRGGDWAGGIGYREIPHVPYGNWTTGGYEVEWYNILDIIIVVGANNMSNLCWMSPFWLNPSAPVCHALIGWIHQLLCAMLSLAESTSSCVPCSHWLNPLAPVLWLAEFTSCCVTLSVRIAWLWY